MGLEELFNHFGVHKWFTKEKYPKKCSRCPKILNSKEELELHTQRVHLR